MTLLVGIAAALALALSAVPLEEGITDAAILVGMEGSTRSFAVDEENLGIRLVFDEVNARGGIHGRRLVERSYPRPVEGAVEQEVKNAARLVEEDGVFMLVNFGGPAALQIGPYAMEKKVPYLFPHSALLTVDGARYVFTSFPRYEGESGVMLRYLSQTRGFKRLGVVHDPNAYGKFFLDRVRDQALALGYTFVGSRAISSPQPQDVTDEMRELRKLAPDAVVMALYPAQARKVLEAKASLDWSDVRMVSTGPLTDEQYLDVAGRHSEGTLGFCQYPDPTESREPGVAAYRELMSRVHPGHALNRYSLYGYVFAKLVVAGLERAGRELTRESFIGALESIQDWESGGILPPLSFSKTNHHAQRAGFICELTAGRFRPITGWIEP